MRILLVSTSYPRDESDWRGVFMRHLVSALARRPEIDLDVWMPPGKVPQAVRVVMTKRESAWLVQLMTAGGISHLMRRGGVRAWATPITLLRMLRAVYHRQHDVDVYHINWLQCALPLPADGKPALITVLGNDLNLLRLPLMRRMLLRVMRRRNVTLCPNAEWMVGPLKEAFEDRVAVVPVSFGIDPCWYKVERNFRTGQPVRWLVVTRLTANKLGPLFEWSQELFGDGRHELHLFGPMQESVDVPEWVHYHGSATAEQLVSEWFPYAHGLITLSRHAEGRPQVMLEAMASGLPIIASRAPAHASIVENGVTGLLCGSAEEYRAALETLGNPDVNLSMGEAARVRMAREMGTWDDCVQRYLQVYRDLLGNMSDA